MAEPRASQFARSAAELPNRSLPKAAHSAGCATRKASRRGRTGETLFPGTRDVSELFRWRAAHESPAEGEAVLIRIGARYFEATYRRRRFMVRFGPGQRPQESWPETWAAIFEGAHDRVTD